MKITKPSTIDDARALLKQNGEGLDILSWPDEITSALLALIKTHPPSSEIDNYGCMEDLGLLTIFHPSAVIAAEALDVLKFVRENGFSHEVKVFGHGKCRGRLTLAIPLKLYDINTLKYVGGSKAKKLGKQGGGAAALYVMEKRRLRNASYYCTSR